MPEFQTVVYETPAPRVARIVLNRVETRNAQNAQLLYDLNDAFDLAARDDEISVIILAANGPHFSSGHDLLVTNDLEVLEAHDTVGTWCGFSCVGAEAQMAKEKELYIGLSERWRNIPKPTIAAVHGKVISGGLMLIWPCDLIVASEDAVFVDNTILMGMCGVEFFHHPWEFGVRRAKELLFTADELSANEARELGMVNHVVPRGELAEFTLALASRIAEKPLFALKLTKEAVNATQDAQGRVTAMQTTFALHQLCHTHNLHLYGSIVDPAFVERQFGRKIAPAEKT